MGNGDDGEGFWRNGKFYWKGNEMEAYEAEKASRELREKLNGVEPQAESYCNCGAKFDRDFPNIHSFFCKAYKGNK